MQRRIAEQVKEFHLDERFAVGKEVLGRNLAAGREKANTVFNKLYADMEALKESQRKKHEEAKREAERNGTAVPSPSFQAPDLNGAKQTVQSVGSKAGAYIGSWGTWMGEKRKTGWGRNSSSSGMQKSKEYPASPPRPVSYRNGKPAAVINSIDSVNGRPKTQERFKESIFDADANHHTPSHSVEVKKEDMVSTPRSDGSHEEMKDDDKLAVTPSEEAKAWEETIPKKPDAAEPSSAVGKRLRMRLVRRSRHD